ncbi:tetratricopeptide repeat-containing sensor histidine kinase [Ferruginibacter paludis]|uniref:tetratricopeptide repeat-containing sensor histidine kinase n=1 Tax=Ferruginibacter paludis TaxID=1310417 RepID=UPI0025B3EE76|nr:tetratricopeptide repeat-containing sensor histidine kinase [Ferruginibacter paludis]MDN3656037.1 tetratricopeptide repeat-containing sensor histidine kinase [Ferruginibacter paludis]
MNPITKFIILSLTLCFQQSVGYSQQDSTTIWANELMNSKSQEEGLAVDLRIKNHLQQNSDKELIFNTTYFLQEAAKAAAAKYIFYDLFYIFQNESQKRKLDKEFNLAVLKMEENPTFASHDVKYQLYYFYSQFYYHLKEYYYATKYINLFLAGGKNAFPENIQSNIDLNSLTTLALINRNKNNTAVSIEQFKEILELSKAKKNSAWEGITSGNLAYTLTLANRLSEAIPYYKRDEQLSLQNNEPGSALNTRISLSELYLKLNKLDSAFKYSESANQLLASIIASGKRDNNFYLDEQQQIFSFFGNYYNQTGDFKKSSNYFTRAFLLRDSIQQEQKTNHLQQIVQNIEVDKNINAINELHNEIKDKKQYLNFIITVAVAVTSILLLLAYFLVRLLSKNKTLKEQNEIINQQRAALEKINSDNYKLFSIISHDVRGPAATLHKLLQLMASKKVSTDDFERLLPSVLTNSTNLNATIGSLLTWSTSQLNGMQTKPETVEIKSFIDSIILLFQEQAKTKSITIENNCYPQSIFIDKNQFEIIVRNTISNALKFSHPGAVISFNLKDSGNNITLTLSDTGVGMTATQIDNIIHQQDLKTTTGTTGEKGVGLGLKLVNEFMEKNAGTFKIESTVGVGTTLIFTIPKAGE